MPAPVLGGWTGMASRISLQGLVEALANAVIEAQHRMQQHQINNISRFFYEDNRPITVGIRTPSVHPDAEPAEDGTYPEDEHTIPLLPLITPNQLTIKEMEVQFEAELGEVTEDQPPKRPRRGLVDRLKSGRKHRDEEPPESAQAEDGNHRGDWLQGAPRPVLSVGTEVSTGLRRAATAQITLKVESNEPPEGLARLIDRLVKTI